MHTQLLPESKEGALNRANILLLEREHDLRKAIVLSMLQMDMHVTEASTIEQARNYIQEQLPDPADDLSRKVFILDLDFPDGKSSELINLFRQKNDGQQAIVLVITAERPMDTWRTIYKPDAILYKPLDVRYLIKKLKAWL